MAVAFLPWQQREVDIRVEDPIPMSFRDRAELQRDISEGESGEFSVRGYDVRKATPFGDGVLVAALGAAIAVAGFVALTTRRLFGPALLTTASGSLAALAVGLYDNFIYQPGVDWSNRDWYVEWGQDSAVRIDTQPAFGMFLMLVVAAYLAWRSISMIREARVSGLSGHESNLLNSDFQSA